MARQGMWGFAFLILAHTLPAFALETVFFSEYVEGSNNNRALEIYNPTDAPITLTAIYTVQLFFNGNPAPGTTINLTGTIAAGHVFVLANTLASASVLAVADQTSGSLNFNGNDAVVLRANGTILDVIGKIGEDPGASGWGLLTADHTLRRKGSICFGDANGTDAFDPNPEWTSFAADTFGGLGVHTANCDAPIPAAPTGLLASPLKGRVHLRWDSALDATSYVIKRSQTPGGPYDTIGTVPRAPFLDTAATNGITWYYVITPVNIEDEIGPDSAEVSATPDTEARIVIAEIYGGGNGEATDYDADYIELFNRGKTPMSLFEWSVQHAFSTGTTWELTTLPDLIVQPGKFVLVREFSPAAIGPMPLPSYDAIGTMDLGVNAGKIALSITKTALTGSDPHLGAEVVDFVGYGTADAYEGTPAPTTGPNTEAVTRISPCVDTNDNGADFQAAAPNPRNSAAAGMTCNEAPAISLSLPSPQSVAEAATITFTVTGSDADGDALTFAFSGLSTTPDAPSLTGSGNVRTFSWTPNFTRAPGPYVVTFTVSDASSSTQATMTINVTNTIEPPANVVATVNADGDVSVTWTASGGAATYDIYRVSSTGGTVVGNTDQTSFLDTTADENTAYFYSVFAINGAASSPASDADLATTVVFEDPTLTPSVTPIRARHFEQLRIAANAIRVLAGLAETIFDDPVLGGVVTARDHLDKIRAALDAARSELHLPPLTHSDPIAINASDVMALRAAVK